MIAFRKSLLQLVKLREADYEQDELLPDHKPLDTTPVGAVVHGMCLSVRPPCVLCTMVIHCLMSVCLSVCQCSCIGVGTGLETATRTNDTITRSNATVDTTSTTEVSPAAAPVPTNRHSGSHSTRVMREGERNVLTNQHLWAQFLSPPVVEDNYTGAYAAAATATSATRDSKESEIVYNM